jgi:hypothetical protein
MPTAGVFLVHFLIRALLLDDKDGRSQSQQAMPFGDTEHLKMSPAKGQCLSILFCQRFHNLPAAAVFVLVVMG